MIKYEYYWLRNYVALNSENQVKNDLVTRTTVFNALGNDGWELIPTVSAKGHFCFRRPFDLISRTKWEYYWLRDFIPLYSDTQIQNDMDKRSKRFNELSSQDWMLVMDDLSMFCFMKCK